MTLNHLTCITSCSGHKVKWSWKKWSFHKNKIEVVVLFDCAFCWLQNWFDADNVCSCWVGLCCVMWCLQSNKRLSVKKVQRPLPIGGVESTGHAESPATIVIGRQKRRSRPASAGSLPAQVRCFVAVSLWCCSDEPLCYVVVTSHCVMPLWGFLIEFPESFGWTSGMSSNQCTQCIFWDVCLGDTVHCASLVKL